MFASTRLVSLIKELQFWPSLRKWIIGSDGRKVEMGKIPTDDMIRRHTKTGSVNTVGLSMTGVVCVLLVLYFMSVE